MLKFSYLSTYIGSFFLQKFYFFGRKIKGYDEIFGNIYIICQNGILKIN